jgi:hypothetical protein
MNKHHKRLVDPPSWPPRRQDPFPQPLNVLRNDPPRGPWTWRAALRLVLVLAYCLLLAMGVLWLSAAVAQPATWVAATVAAYHPDRDYARQQGLRDVTPGLGLEREAGALLPDGRLLAGYLRNSYGRSSLYAGAAWLPAQVLGVRAGAMAGAINGYPHNGGRWGPMAAGVLSVERGGLGANLVIAPKWRDKVHGAIALQLKAVLP